MKSVGCSGVGRRGGGGGGACSCWGDLKRKKNSNSSRMCCCACVRYTAGGVGKRRISHDTTTAAKRECESNPRPRAPNESTDSDACIGCQVMYQARAPTEPSPTICTCTHTRGEMQRARLMIEIGPRLNEEPALSLVVVKQRKMTSGQTAGLASRGKRRRSYRAAPSKGTPFPCTPPVSSQPQVSSIRKKNTHTQTSVERPTFSCSENSLSRCAGNTSKSMNRDMTLDQVVSPQHAP